MPRRTTLFKKYALIFSALIGGSLLISGLLGIHFSYQENKASLMRLQREKAEGAAERIAHYLFGIEQRISLTAVSANSSAALTQRSFEIQLLKRTAAIRELALLDLQGREHLRVSRRALDVVDSGRDFSTADFFPVVQSGRTYRSPAYFREGALYMTVAMAVGPPSAGITVAEIDLEFFLDGISRIKVGDSGHAYAVDARGHLIAHPDIGMVLKNISLANLPQVQAAIANPAQNSRDFDVARSYDGDPVLTAFASIPQLGWFVFVEESLAEAYRPLYAQAIHGALLVLAGMLVALLACVALVRRMVRPIHALEEGARRIGQGMLGHRIAVQTGDELEELASQFNSMAERLQESYTMLEQRVAERTQELEQSNALLAALSSTDALTGIANRRRFDEVLASEWSRASRTGQPLALGMLDVDWFKAYNDHCGHQAGDACLRRVAEVLAAGISRTGDLVARYGGEEFVFIAPATDAQQMLHMAQRINKDLYDLHLPHEQSPFGCLTASIGVAVMVPTNLGQPDVLVQSADQALYRAKASGRNRVVLFAAEDERIPA